MGRKTTKLKVDRKPIGVCIWCARPATRRTEIPWVKSEASGELVVAETSREEPGGTVRVRSKGKVKWETAEFCASCYNQVWRTGSPWRTNRQMKTADVQKALQMISEGHTAADALRWLRANRGVQISRPGFYAALDRGYQEFGYPNE